MSQIIQYDIISRQVNLYEDTIASIEKHYEIRKQLEENIKDTKLKFSNLDTKGYHSIKIDIDDSDKEYALELAKKSAWSGIIDISGIKMNMDSDSIKELNSDLMKNTPEFTHDNIEETFKSLFSQADEFFVKGIVNSFSKLDRRFKSHSVFNIKSRIILTGFLRDDGTVSSFNSRRDELNDIHRVVCRLDGMVYKENYISDLLDDRGLHSVESEHYKINRFKNNNGHIYFLSRHILDGINRILHDYYGDVLPDGVEKEEEIKAKGTALSKDLAFYPTPKETMERLIEKTSLKYHINSNSSKNINILEPSAGEGHMIREIIAISENNNPMIHAFEYDANRVERLKEIKYEKLQVRQYNFLQVKPHPIYDFVIMNPPFASGHYREHVMHAWDFVAPGGKLIAILPIGADINEDKQSQLFRKWVVEKHDSYFNPFRDLPSGSFKTSGTNIDTVYIELSR